MPAPTIMTTNTVAGATIGDDTLTGTVANDLIQGLAGNDTLSGGGGDDQIEGDDGDDILTGNAGNDNLVGGLGTNTLTGGVGNDNYTIISASDTIAELVGEGTDTVYADVSHNLAANVENIVLEAATALNSVGNALNNVMTGNGEANIFRGGAGNDTLIGGAGVDQLFGEDGADILNGGLGADTMTGGDATDTYTVDDIGDVVVEIAGDGAADAVFSSVTYTLSAEVENLTLTGAAAINGTGNAGINTITGNAGANSLQGGAGNDTLIGGAGVDQLFGEDGADILNGGLGADTMTGGDATDTYTVNDIGDVVVEVAGEGAADTVSSSVTYTLSAEVENLTLGGSSAIAGTGNASANIISAGGDGLAVNNRIDGGAGADTMSGGQGLDSYFIDNEGDTITENPGEGRDQAFATASVGRLDANVENLRLLGTADLQGNGNGLANFLYGNAGDNVMNGREGRDYILGFEGNDKIIGGTGRDNLWGGMGDDDFIYSDWRESVAGRNRDVIRDFVSGSDDIDLSRIESGVVSGAFTFIGDEAFSGRGQVRFENNVISGDIQGDGIAEFHIVLAGVNALTVDDFIL